MHTQWRPRSCAQRTDFKTGACDWRHDRKGFLKHAPNAQEVFVIFTVTFHRPNLYSFRLMKHMMSNGYYDKMLITQIIWCPLSYINPFMDSVLRVYNPFISQSIFSNKQPQPSIKTWSEPTCICMRHPSTKFKYSYAMKVMQLICLQPIKTVWGGWCNINELDEVAEAATSNSKIAP